MMGTQGPQGSRGQESGSDTEGSMCAEGCTGVKGIWRDKGQEKKEMRQGQHSLEIDLGRRAKGT